MQNGGKANEKKLKAHVKSELAGYKVPRRWVFHDELPRNETGKLPRMALDDLVARLAKAG